MSGAGEAVLNGGTVYSQATDTLYALDAAAWRYLMASAMTVADGDRGANEAVLEMLLQEEGCPAYPSETEGVEQQEGAP